MAYIHRVAISMMAPEISRDLGLSKSQMGSIFGAFALAYALFEIPGGWLGDWLGVRRVLIGVVLWWSTFTAATGWMWNQLSLWLARFLFGMGQAACFPNLTKAFTVWLTPHERVRAQGIMWLFARWGGAFTPPMVVFVLSLPGVGWRNAFVILGVVGLVWVWFFARWFCDRPGEHPSVNRSELDLLRGSESRAAGHREVPWRRWLKCGNVWLLWAQYFAISYPWYFFITWLPTYLQENRHLSPEISARYAILPLFFGGLGCVASSWVQAPLAVGLQSLALSRKLPAFSGMVMAGGFLLAATHLNDPLYAMIAMGLASFCNDLVMPSAWAACMDIGGKYAGTLAGSMNMMGNLAGFVAPTVGGLILVHTGGDWTVFLWSMSAVYFVGSFTWLLIDPVTPLPGSEGKSQSASD